MLDAGLIAGGRESREIRHTVFFTPLDHGVLKKKKKNNIVMILRGPEKFTSKQDRSTLRTLLLGFILGEHKKRHSILANEIACNHHRQHGATWLYWTSHHTPRSWHDRVQKMFTALFRRSRGKLLAGHSPRLHALTMLRKEESSLQVDLRVHGASQDDIYKDWEQITEMQNLVDRLQDGCRDKQVGRNGQYWAVRT